jgi:hypothetical protein
LLVTASITDATTTFTKGDGSTFTTVNNYAMRCKLDGNDGTYYRNADNINAGTLNSNRLAGTYTIDIAGNALQQLLHLQLLTPLMQVAQLQLHLLLQLHLPLLLQVV